MQAVNNSQIDLVPDAMAAIVSIIYVNYNTSGLLIKSIQSVINTNKEVAFEIIIVDNASSGKERKQISEWVAQQNEGNIRLLMSENNLGFGKANNLAASYASGKYLFFLNPDTKIINNVVAMFYNFMECSTERIAACGGNLLKPDHSPNDSYGNFPGLLLELCNIGIGLRLLFDNYYKKNVAIGSTAKGEEIRKVPYVVGADLFIRLSYFNSINGFDENYFLYYEETDLFKKLSSIGLEAYLLPHAKIIHYEGGAIEQHKSNIYNYFKFEVLLASKRYYYKKWFGKGYAALLEPIFLLQIMVQYAKGKMGNDFVKLCKIYLKKK